MKLIFDNGVTTTTIAEEFGEVLPEWIHIRLVKNLSFQNSLDVDAGEASAITLALESEPSLLIIDDFKGRKATRRLNLKFTDTLGVLLKAKQLEVTPSIKPLLEKIQQTNFRYSEAVFKEILFLANE